MVLGYITLTTSCSRQPPIQRETNPSLFLDVEDNGYRTDLGSAQARLRIFVASAALR